MDLIGFFKHVGHDIKVVAIKVAHGFAAIFGSDAAQAFGHAALDLLKSALGQIVVAEVQALEGITSLSGIEKAAQAQAAILEKAESLGLSTSKSIINLLIELAVQFVKGNLETVAKV